MAFPYQYVDYSNPTTPRVYTWEVEPDPAQHQQPQHHLQPIEDSQPMQLQQQQQQQQPQQQQHSPAQRQQAYQPPPTIQLQERAAPGHYHFDNITEQDFLNVSGDDDRSESSRRRAASKPPLRVDTKRSGSSPAASSAGAGPSSSMPMRVQYGRAHAQSAHPYRRPSSGASTAGHGKGKAAVRSRRVSEQQQPTESPAGGVHPTPVVGTSATVSCPAANAWRGSMHKLGSAGTTSLDAATTPQNTAAGAIRPRRYIIRTDVHFDPESNTMTAMLELPGLKKSDLRMTLWVCPYSRVKQLSISGVSRPVFPEAGHTVHERNFGEFMRTLVVPPETQSEDINASLEDGILILTIPGGTPAEYQRPQDIILL